MVTFILGTSSDGPLNTPVRVKSVQEAKMIFGNFVRDYRSLSAGDSSIYLEYPVRDEKISLYELTSSYTTRLYPGFSLSVDGYHKNKVNFGALHEALEAVFYYERKPERHDVVKLYEEFLQGDGGASEVYLVRLGGAVASTTIHDGATTPNNFITLTSRNGGVHYNNISAVVDSTSLTIYLPPGLVHRAKVTYTLSNFSTIASLCDKITRDSYAGINLVSATSLSDDTDPTTLPPGTFTFSGGADDIGGDQDVLYDALVATLRSLTGIEMDMLICPLPYFLRRVGIYTEGINVTSVDFRTYEYLAAGSIEIYTIAGDMLVGDTSGFWALDGVENDDLWAIDEEARPEEEVWTTDTTGVGSSAISTTLTGEEDGTTHYYCSEAQSIGLYEVTAPSSITKSGRDYDFKYWWIYGTYLGDSGLGDTEWPVKYTSNPVQVVVGDKEVQMVAVYDTDDLAPLRAPETPGAQTPISLGTFQAWAYTSSAGSPNLPIFCTVLKEFLGGGETTGIRPLICLPTMTLGEDPV